MVGQGSARSEQRTVALHIGTHKTGSTSFQTWAEGNRSRLRDECGLEYYRGRFGPSHFELAMLCLRADRNMPARTWYPDWCLADWQDDVRAHVREQMQGPAPSLLVSAEALSYLRHPDELARLATLVEPRIVSVIVVLREPGAYMRSYSAQLGRLGFAPSPYRGSFAYVADDSWLTDYEALVRVYADAFGSDSVTVIEYEAALARHGSVIPEIMEARSLAPDRIPAWKDVWLNGPDGGNASPERPRGQRREVAAQARGEAAGEARGELAAQARE